MRVALLGYGFAGKTIHAPLIGSEGGLELAQVMSSNAARVQADLAGVAVTGRADEVFQNPAVDLVVIATPNSSHFDLAQRALRAGKHVVIDKPFTVTVDEGRELIELAKARGLLLSVFHCRRWDADFLTVRGLLERGELGEVMLFESHYDRYRPVVQNRWREQAGAGSGIWFDLGSHLADQALQLFGRPDSISVDLGIQRDGGTAIDYFHVVLHYGKMRAILHGSNLVAAETPRFQIHGTAASFVKFGMDPQEPSLRRGCLPGCAGWGEDPRRGTLTTASESRLVETVPGDYRVYYAAVRDAIVNGGPNPVPAEQALEVVGLLRAAESAHAVHDTIRTN